MILTNCDYVRMTLPDGSEVKIHPDRENYPHLPHPPAILTHEDFADGPLGKWGMRWQDVTFTGVLNGQDLVHRTLVADPVATTLEVVADSDSVEAGFEEVRISVRALDQAGNLMPFIDAPVEIQVTGQGTLIGPAKTSLRGGATGFWVRTSGDTGAISIRVSSPRFEPQVIALTAV